MITVRKICLLFLLALAGLTAFNPVQAETPKSRLKEAQKAFSKLRVSRFEQMFQTGKFDFKSCGRAGSLYRFTVMHYAAFMGDLNRVKLLAEKGGDINVKTSNDMTPLHFAAQSGNLDLVQWLVEQGADVNAKGSDYGETALYYAIKGGNYEIVQWLLEHGAKLYPDESEFDDDGGESESSSDINEMLSKYLFAAVQSGNLKLVQWLIEQGADIKDVNMDYAAQSGSLELVQWLYEQGIDITNDLNDAAQSGNLELVQWMADHGADLMIEDSIFGNALNNAAYSGNLELVQWLANKGVEVTDEAVVLAAHSGNLDLVKWLVNQGVDIHAADSCGATGMCSAVLTGNIEMVQYLMNEGINVNASLNTKSFLPALDLAVLLEDFEMIQYLVEHGANVNPGFRIIPYWHSLSRIGVDPEIVEYLKKHDNSLVYKVAILGLIILAICGLVIYRIKRPRRLPIEE